MRRDSTLRRFRTSLPGASGCPTMLLPRLAVRSTTLWRDSLPSSRPLPGIRHGSNHFHGAAVDGLQRSVEDLGLKGAMVHGLSRGRFVDDEEFWLRRIDLDENLKEGIFSRNAAALLGL